MFHVERDDQVKPTLGVDRPGAGHLLRVDGDEDAADAGGGGGGVEGGGVEDHGVVEDQGEGLGQVLS